MKTLAVTALLLCCLSPGAFASGEMETLEEMGRVVFIDSDGTPTVNTTSIIYGLLIAVPLIVVALIVLPALGIDLNTILDFSTKRSDVPNYQYYQEYAERSLNEFSPIIEMLRKAYEKYF